MSASSMPTLSPRSRSPSARLTAVVDFPTPPLPEATAIMAPTPGMPDCDRRCGAPASRARRAMRRPCARPARARRWRRRGRARRALAGERHHGPTARRVRRAPRLGALAHRLPSLDVRGIDRDREEHLAVADDDFGQLPVAGNGRPSGEPPRQALRESSSLSDAMTYPRSDSARSLATPWLMRRAVNGSGPLTGPPGIVLQSSAAMHRSAGMPKGGRRWLR